MDEWGLVLYTKIWCFGDGGKNTEKSQLDSLTQFIITRSKGFTKVALEREVGL